MIVTMNRQFPLITTFLTMLLITLSSNLLAKNESQLEPLPIDTVIQDKIRPSYPFPSFLSTGPYVWYDGAQNKPIKGHTFRIATFSEQRQYRIFIEKVEFGDGGCCLEIIDYRQLMINEQFLKKHFPHNNGQHGFKLIRWINTESFEFEAYSGIYQLSNINDTKPLLKELTNKLTKE